MLLHLLKTADITCSGCLKLIETTLDTRQQQDINNLILCLLVQKDRGGLVYPSVFTIRLVTAAEKVSRMFELMQLSGERLNLEVLNIIGGPPQESVPNAVDKQNGASNH